MHATLIAMKGIEQGCPTRLLQFGLAHMDVKNNSLNNVFSRLLQLLRHAKTYQDGF